LDKPRPDEKFLSGTPRRIKRYFRVTAWRTQMEPYRDRDGIERADVPRDGMRWDRGGMSMGMGIVLAVLVIGGLFYAMSHMSADNGRLASNAPSASAPARTAPVEPTAPRPATP
jgi:hypothetical protein